MLKSLLAVLIVLVAMWGYSQNIYDQLDNSVERTDGGAGATVKYHVYVSPTNIKLFYAKDWEKGEVVKKDGVVTCFELTRQKDGEEESLLINLSSLSYLELEVKSNKGTKEFSYHFFY